MKKHIPEAVPPRSGVLAPHNLPYQMFLLVQQMTRAFQQVLDRHGLTPLHWGILCCLWVEDGLPTSEITRRLEQLGGTITVGLDAMQKRGLIERLADKADRRISRVRLTKAGRELRPVVIPEVEELVTRLFGGLDPIFYENLYRQVQELRQHLRASNAAPEEV